MFFQIIFITVYATSVLGNYYDILGISRSATDIDIKSSYKKLARQWHPDKNRSPEANGRFTAINEAYEVLSNSDKRKEYDAFGSVSNDPHDNRRQQGHFGNAYFDFGQNDESKTQFESTSYRHYKIDILPNSFNQPTLILLVSHFCFACHHAMRLWGSIANQITESGIRITLCDVMADGHLREELRIHHVPTVVMIIDGQVKYLQTEINKETVTDFIRHSFPRDLVQSIETEDELNHFHDSWPRDSRSKMLMTKPLDRPSFRYLSIAFKYRDKISAGFVNIGNSDKRARTIGNAYGVRNTEEAVLIFHDEKRYYPDNVILPKPVAQKSQSRLSLSDIDNIVTTNYMLPFPRLLSQSIFDVACPAPSQKQRSFGFCVIAVVHSKHRHNLSQSDSWQYVRSLIGDSDHGKMLYMFGDVQYRFLQSLQLVDPAKTSIDTFMDQVILLWRQSYSSATSLFLSNPWQYANLEMVLQNWKLLSNFDKALSILKTQNQIQTKITDSDTLSELVDELASPLWMKIGSRLLSYCQQIYIYVYDIVTEPFNFIILFLALAFASYVYYNVKAGLTHIVDDAKHKHDPSHYSKMASTGMSDLSNERYCSLLSTAQSGQLVIVVLTTNDTPHSVLLLIQHCVANLKCMNRLQTVRVCVDLHPHWLQSLLANLANDDDHKRGLSCIANLTVNRPFAYEGIVLALNLHRCYLSICPFNVLLSRPPPPHDAYFDLDTSDSSADSTNDNDHHIHTAHNIDLNARFFDWLCQLMDGTCTRYHVSHWPPALS